MGDIVFLAVMLAFFALCVLYVRGCDRIIESADDDSAAEHTPASTPPAEERAA